MITPLKPKSYAPGRIGRGFLAILGLWDFAWWVHRDVNFSPRITQIALIFYFSRVNSRLILARPCEILKSRNFLWLFGNSRGRVKINHGSFGDSGQVSRISTEKSEKSVKICVVGTTCPHCTVVKNSRRGTYHAKSQRPFFIREVRVDPCPLLLTPPRSKLFERYGVVINEHRLPQSNRLSIL